MSPIKSDEAVHDLSAYRASINELDRQLIEILGERFEICLKVADYKKENDIPMMQPDRIQMVKQRCIGIGEKFGVDAHFIDRLYSLIIDEACRLEDKAMH
ncbi:chorismate mutase [Paenibacillus sp. sgz500958]|uniref:chorismate mutase n=1 Tax=Paenibacillus sp. sgz500958 TaxID=3242475 RepID=UPI0036D24890